MKKLTIILPLLFAALVFSGCKDPANGVEPETNRVEEKQEPVNEVKTEENPENEEEPKENEPEDKNFGYQAPSLPESQGTDFFKGKTFVNENSKFVFNDDNTVVEYSGVYPYCIYEYSYNESSKLMYLRIVEMEADDKLIPIPELISLYLDIIKDCSEEDYELYTVQLQDYISEFNKLNIWKIEYSDNKISLQENYYTEIPDFVNSKWLFESIKSENHKSPYVYVYSFLSKRPFASTTKHLGAYLSISSSTSSFGGTVTDIKNDIFYVELVNNYSEEKTSLEFSYTLTLNNGILALKLSAANDSTKAFVKTITDNPETSFELFTPEAEILTLE